jgi:hypothetical protein
MTGFRLRLSLPKSGDLPVLLKVISDPDFYFQIVCGTGELVGR